MCCYKNLIKFKKKVDFCLRSIVYSYVERKGGDMRKKNKLIPRIMWIPLFLTLACNAIAYNGSRLLTTDRPHYNLSNNLDEQIPFIPWMIIIYLGCYIFWIVNYVIGCRQEKEEAFRFIGADLVAKLVCLVCFLVFPTTNTRPVIEGNSIWDELMRILYRIDAADNLFPSIHCLTSWFCFIAVRGNKNVAGWYKAASLLMALSVCVSTLTTKQHVMIDVIAGVALAEGCYLLADKSGFSKWYMNIVSKMNIKMIGWGESLRE